MPELIIRPAQNADYPAIKRILGYYIAHTTASWRYSIPGPEWEQDFATSHRTAERPVLVAEQAGTIIGYSCLSDFRSYEGYWPCAENSVYVWPDYQHNQVGRQLMEALLEKAAATRLQKIIAAIDSENQRSIHFHERLGFWCCGELKDIGYKMERWLSLVLLEYDLNQIRQPDKPF
jgi:phosphinothricin acetyltransferase